ncbi:MAG: glycosyltransferase family 61 protein [Spirochaetia bacterium]|jgi:capsular polysaccharide biosynthesis protein
MRILDKENVVRPLPRNLKAGEESLFSHEHSRKIPPTDLIDAQDAEVLPNGFVRVGGRLLPQVFLGMPRGVRALKAWLRIRQYHLRARKVGVERALFITDDWSNGFFHWIGEVLPRLEALGSSEAEARTLLVPAMADFDYARQSLEPYSLGDIRFLSWSERASCRDLLVVPPLAPTGNYRPAVMSALRDRMRRWFGASQGGRRLYISRVGSAARRIANESEMLPVLERHGFERVLSERLSFSEQVRLVGSASMLIGNHGAGLTHACWMLPGTALFELRRQGDSANNCYYSLAGALGIRYYYLMCKAADERKATHAADLVVDPALLEAELAALTEGQAR